MFYQKLGFVLTGCYPDPSAPTWAEVKRMDYGMREFAVQDPNGYFIAFTEPA